MGKLLKRFFLVSEFMETEKCWDTWVIYDKKDFF